MSNNQTQPLAIDLRGSMEHPFGYLEEDNERYRLGFTWKDGKIFVWVGNWGPPDPDFMVRAKVTLAKYWANVPVVFGSPS